MKNFLLILVFFSINSVCGQTIGRENHERLKINFSTGELENKDPKGSDKIPFDVPFILEGEVPKDVVMVEIAYVETKKWGKENCNCTCFDYLNTETLPCNSPKTNHEGEVETREVNAGSKDDPRCKAVCPWKVNILSNLELCDGTKKCANNLFWVEIPALEANKNYKFFFKFHTRPTGIDSTKLVKGIYHILLGKFDKYQIGLNQSEVNAISILINDLVNSHYRLKSYDQIQFSNGEYLTNTAELEKLLLNKNALFGHVDYTKWPYPDEGYILGTSSSTLKQTLKDFQSLNKNILSELQNLTDNELDFLSSGRLDYQNPDFTLQTVDTYGDSDSVKLYVRNLGTFADSLASFRRENIPDYIALSSQEKDLYIKLERDIREVLGKLEKYEKYIRQYNEVLLEISGRLIDQINFTGGSSLSTIADFKTRTEYYVTADLGVAHVFYKDRFSNELVTYYGVNFNLFPVNRQRPYSLIGSGFKDFHKNLSVVVGFTEGSNDDAEGRFNSLGDRSLMTGIGIRVSDPVRMTVGGIWNEVQGKTSPFDTDKELRMYPFVSISYDLDVIKYVRVITNPIFNRND